MPPSGPSRSQSGPFTESRPAGGLGEGGPPVGAVRGRCYNSDVRRDQRYLAENGLLACAGPGEDQFSTELDQDLYPPVPRTGAVEAYRRQGISDTQGMTIRNEVTDASAGLAGSAWEALSADRAHYGRLLEKAWLEVAAGPGKSTAPSPAVATYMSGPDDHSPVTA